MHNKWTAELPFPPFVIYIENIKHLTSFELKSDPPPFPLSAIEGIINHGRIVSKISFDSPKDSEPCW